MSLTKKGEDFRNDRPLICLRDLSSYTRRSNLFLASADDNMKMKPSSPPPPPPPLPRPRQPSCSPSGAPVVVAPAGSTRQLSSTGVALKVHDTGEWSPDDPCPSESDRRRRQSASPSSTLAVTQKSLGDRTLMNSKSPSASAQQLSKLKRFLGTLEKLGSDISPTIGRRVQCLIRGLVGKEISIEEFHDQLHRTTNFPLRPLVVPFLKSSLPMLQQEVSRLAELSQMTSRQFLLAKTEALFLGAIDCHKDAAESSKSPPTSPEQSPTRGGKRPADDSRHNTSDKDLEADDQAETDGSSTSTAKRMRVLSPCRERGKLEGATTNSYNDTHDHEVTPRRLDLEAFDPAAASITTIPVQDINAVRLITQCLERDRMLYRRQSRNRLLSSGCSDRYTIDAFDRSDEDWNYVENTLQCIVGLVERCQRAMQAIQERTLRNRELWAPKIWTSSSSSSQSSTASSSSSSSLSSCSATATLSSASSCDAILQMRLDIRHPESSKDLDRRRDENQRIEPSSCSGRAVIEPSKTVSDSSKKTSEAIVFDRLKMGRTTEEVRDKTRAELAALHDRQINCYENCWNCGRLATETCSGCNKARYCGIFCQHRHWEFHHMMCGKAASPASRQSQSKLQEPNRYFSHRGSSRSSSAGHCLPSTLNEDRRTMRPGSPSAPAAGVGSSGSHKKTPSSEAETPLIVNVKQEVTS